MADPKNQISREAGFTPLWYRYTQSTIKPGGREPMMQARETSRLSGSVERSDPNKIFSCNQEQGRIARTGPDLGNVIQTERHHDHRVKVCLRTPGNELPTKR
jgi:hypothetical protein